MRKLLLLLALVSTAAVAGGITFDISHRYEFTDCNADGTTTPAQTLGTGTYLFRVTTEDVWVCFAATCSTGGEKFPAGMALIISIGRGGQVMSCRSASSTGDAIFTWANQ